MFFIELEPVFNNDGAVLPLDFEVELKDTEYNSACPFVAPVRVKGKVINSIGIVSLVAKAEFTLNLTCDRCAAPFTRDFSIPVEHILVTETNDEDNDELIVIDSFHYDLEPLVTEDIILSLPTKVLCKEDCLGICHRCGKDLNDGPCDCGKEYDPRWDALLDFTQEDL
ncbi:MAG: DUF177 domain-containing protein [Clostridia bacterium]|nr:DUF177 domain-containing protein [Clostridia bacterium]